MPLFQDLTTTHLRQALQIREQIEFLQDKLEALLGGSGATTTVKKKVGRPAGKRTMSAATIEKMRAAQQARWAPLKSSPAKAAAVSKPKVAPKKKTGMTPEGKAKIAAAMKARWAAKKAAATAA